MSDKLIFGDVAPMRLDGVGNDVPNFWRLLEANKVKKNPGSLK
jgi:hypothetical protein